jgi:hypothetical protein
VKCEGRKSCVERAPEMVELAKAVKNRGGRVSLREVAARFGAGTGTVQRIKGEMAAQAGLSALGLGNGTDSSACRIFECRH